MKCVFTNIPAACPLPDTMRTQIGSSAFYKHTHGRAEYFSIYSPVRGGGCVFVCYQVTAADVADVALALEILPLIRYP